MKRFGIWTAILFVFVVLAAACSSDSGTSKNNAHGADVAVEDDAQTSEDSGSGDVLIGEGDASDEQQDVDQKDDVSDEAEDVTAEDVDLDDATTDDDDAGDETEDVAADVELEEDTDVDEADAPATSEDPYEGRPLGQCTENLECDIMAGGSRSCTRTAPGGLCSGCGANDCGVMAECMQGSCQAICTTKDDCAPGLTCLSGGTCGIERCVNDQCPTPFFGCTESGFCRRIACTQQSDCPTLTTCTDGLCIEDRQL